MRSGAAMSRIAGSLTCDALNFRRGDTEDEIRRRYE